MPCCYNFSKAEKERKREAGEENRNTGSTTDVVLCGQGEAVRGTLGPTTVVIERNLTYQVQRKKPDLTSTWTVILMYQQRIPHAIHLAFLLNCYKLSANPLPQREHKANQNTHTHIYPAFSQTVCDTFQKVLLSDCR